MEESLLFQALHWKFYASRKVYPEIYSNTHHIGYKGIFSKDFHKDFVKSEMINKSGQNQWMGGIAPSLK